MITGAGVGRYKWGRVGCCRWGLEGCSWRGGSIIQGSKVSVGNVGGSKAEDRGSRIHVR